MVTNGQCDLLLPRPMSGELELIATRGPAEVSS
jgi:hypothetical protein